MFYLAFTQIVALLCDWLMLVRRTGQQKDLEILMLRQQLRIMQRHQPKALRLSQREKLGLAVLAARFMEFSRGSNTKLNQTLLLFKPDTVLKWHRDFLRRKWTFTQAPTNGRPPLGQELQLLVLQLARENASWGYGKIHGELLKLGFAISQSAVRNILRQRRIPPAPQRTKQGGSWSNLLSHYGQQILACDFFTVETALLKTLHALFFIEIGTRRVHRPGGTRRLHRTSNGRMGDPASAAIDLDATRRAQRHAFPDP